jgi:hypothetical protein
MISARVARAIAACAALLAAGLLAATTDLRPVAAVAAADTVVLAVYPDGSGSVTVSPAPISVEGPLSDDPSICPGTGGEGASCRFTYPRGTTVTLTAQAEPGTDSVHRGWSEVLCPGIAPCTLPLTDDEEYVAALFSPQHVLINVAGEGTVTANGRACIAQEAGPEGGGVLDCGTFALFETVTLVATGDHPVWDPSTPGEETRSFPCEATSAVTAASATCTVLTDRFRWLRLGFAGGVPNGNLPQPSAARLKVRTRGSGTVTNTSKTIACPGRCSIPGSGGSQETLIARGDPGWRFVRWGLCRADPRAANVCVARLGATVSAEFERAPAAVSRVTYLGASGTRGNRRVRFVVDLGAPGTVRASLIRNRRNYAKPYTRNLAAVRRTVALGVKSGAPRGSYRLKVTISGAAPKKAAFAVKLRR